MGLIPYSIESLCLNFALFTRWPQPLKRFHFENYFIYLRNTLKVFPFIHLGCLFYILICFSNVESTILCRRLLLFKV